MNDKQRGKRIGIAAAVLVHALFVVFLWLMYIEVPKPQEEGGMAVMLGEVADAAGQGSHRLTEVDVLSQEVPTEQPEALPEVAEPQEHITQEAEETVALKPKTEAKKPAPEKAVEKPKPVKTKAQLEAEAKAKAEAEEAARRRAAEEATRKRVAGAFGKGAQMENRGSTSGKGSQGVATGNSDAGAAAGQGAGAGFDLKGRSLGPGGLPRPVYPVREDARVMVNITVNPAGEVIATSINMRGTDNQDAGLHRAAEAAARKARFNRVQGVNNQTGTITYSFKLK